MSDSDCSNSPYRSFIRKVLFGMLLFYRMLGAQEISDKDNSLFVAPGTELHIVTADSRPLVRKEKNRFPKSKKIKYTANTNFRNSEKLAKEKSVRKDAQKKAPPVTIAFTDKESSRISTRQQESFCGILVPGFYKAKFAWADTKHPMIPYTGDIHDFNRHKCLYKELFGRSEISYSNFCRPPPGSSSSQV